MIADDQVSRYDDSLLGSTGSFKGMPHCIPFDEKNTKTWRFSTESALKVIGALEIARGNEFVIPVPKSGITKKEKAKLKRYNARISHKANVGFNLLVQSMGTNAAYQDVISTSCEIGDLKGAWDAIWDKYDSKKPAVQSQLATEFSNCVHMPHETVEQFINRINNICARMVKDPGDAMKKTQVVKGISNEFLNFCQIESRRDISYSEFCVNVKDHATMHADITVFRDKRDILIAADRARRNLSDRSAAAGDYGGDEKAVEDSSLFTHSGKSSHSDKKTLRCWKCDKPGHKSFECPSRRDKKKKKRYEDEKSDRKRRRDDKHLRVRVYDSEASDSDGSH
jgi:hypothetical protein